MAKSTKMNPFSRNLAQAIAKCVPASGETITAEEVASKLGKAFTVAHPEMLKLVIRLAVSSGAVPGYSSVRGPTGGIYKVAARAEQE